MELKRNSAALFISPLVFLLCSASISFFANPLYAAAFPQTIKIDKEELKSRADELYYAEKKKEEKKQDKEESTVAKKQSSAIKINPNWYVIPLCILLAAAVVWLILKFKPNRDNPNGNLVSLDGSDATDANTLQGLQVETALQQALDDKNYRLALRILYLYHLQLFMQKGWIQPARHKTNLEYLQEIKDKRFYAAFKKNTGTFERFWYGELELGQDIYSNIAPDFMRLNDDLKGDV